ADADQIRVSRGTLRDELDEVVTQSVAEPFAFVEEDGTFVSEELIVTESRGPESTRSDDPPGWLDEVDDGATMDFPARSRHLNDLARTPLPRSEVKARVQYLFPRTETNWAVGTRAPRRAAG
ncbi:MAG: hypothetical protein ABIZ50_06270, partial [Solirubrobacterales bacterium]